MSKDRADTWRISSGNDKAGFKLVFVLRKGCGRCRNTRMVFQERILDVLYESAKMDSLIKYEYEWVKVELDKKQLDTFQQGVWLRFEEG